MLDTNRQESYMKRTISHIALLIAAFSILALQVGCSKDAAADPAPVKEKAAPDKNKKMGTNYTDPT